MSALLQATTWTRESETHFSTTIDAQWGNGKGTFGGLLAAGLLRAMTQVVVPPGSDSKRVARTLHVTFCAPAKPGILMTVDVVIERAGGSMTTVTARAVQEGKVVTCATATFAAPPVRPSPGAKWSDARMPDVPAPDELEELPQDTDLVPAFTKFFAFHLCIGAMPYSGDTQARMGGWVRVRDPYTPCDAPLVAALIDSFPPAVMPRLDEVRATASVNLTVDFLAPPLLAQGEAHFLLTSSSRTGDGGTTDETQDLWSAEGVLLASCRQLVVIL